MRPRKNSYRVRVAVAIAAGALALTGCSGGGSNKASANSAITVGYIGVPDSLDPHTAPTPTQMFLLPIYDRLTQYDGNRKLVPMLAKSWEFAKDSSYLELHLRDDVKFHDGSTFNAAAVVANINRELHDPKSTVATQLDGVTSAEAVDQYTVRLALRPGSGATIPDALAGKAGMMVSPKVIKSGADFSIFKAGTVDAGSGPYEIAKHDPKAEVDYKRVAAPWDSSASTVKKLTIKFIADPNTIMNATQSGEVQIGQVAGDPVPTALKRASGGAFEVEESPEIYSNSLLMNTSGAFADPEVRRTIAQSIDKKAISSGLYQSKCQINDSVYPPGHFPMGATFNNPLPYDPAAAKKRLADAGYKPNQVNVTLNTAIGGSAAAIAEIIQSQLKVVGIKAKVASVPQADLFVKFKSRHVNNQLGVVFGWTEPMSTFNDYFLDPANLNLAGKDRSQFDFVKKATDPSLSEGQRAAIFRKGLELAVSQAYIVPICNPEQAWIHSKSVKGMNQTVGMWFGSPDLGRHLSVTN